jgi:hypothetical protein
MRPRFVDDVFAARRLDAAPPAELNRLVPTVLQHRAFLLTGAGISVSVPTGLPSGRELANRLAEWAEQNGLQNAVIGVNRDDLGLVAEAVEDASTRSILIRALLCLTGWRRAPFNLCHFAIAMLYAEGLLDVSFTANWDDKVHEAADWVEGLDLSCPCDIATLNVATTPRFVHMHGHVEHPDTLVATARDLGRPEALAWTEPQFAATLAQADAVLVGFAAEPEYVVETIRQMRIATGRDPIAVVSTQTRADFLAQSPTLAAATGIDNDPLSYVRLDACEALTEPLRVFYGSRLSHILSEAEQRAQQIIDGRWVLSPATVASAREAFLGHSVDELLQFLWQGAALEDDPDSAAQPNLRSREDDLTSLLTTLLILASCSDVSALDRLPNGIRLQRLIGDVHVWPLMPFEHVRAATAYSAAVKNSSMFVRPTDPGVPLLLVCARTFGAVPRHGHPLLAGAPRPGALAGAVRIPTDVLNLDDLEDRVVRLPAGTPHPPALGDLVRIP